MNATAHPLNEFRAFVYHRMTREQLGVCVCVRFVQYVNMTNVANLPTLF